VPEAEAVGLRRGQGLRPVAPEGPGRFSARGFEPRAAPAAATVPGSAAACGGR